MTKLLKCCLMGGSPENYLESSGEKECLRGALEGNPIVKIDFNC